MKDIKVKCRFCDASLKHTFIDIGMTPVANTYLQAEQLYRMEPFFPLHVYVCEKCYLVQLPEIQSPEQIFSEYAYFSSYSETWLNHARVYVEQITERFRLDPKSQVIEIASNDGYLLQYFLEKDIPVLGIEPAANVANAARSKGIPTEVLFFGSETACKLEREGKSADILIGNNVLAHVPALNDFIKGMKILLKPRGIITMEFPHLMRLVAENQFDTIYHEHFSYFSFITVKEIFSAHKLTIFDVEELPTHGGSLRIYIRHEEDNTKDISGSVSELEEREFKAGYRDITYYSGFKEKVEAIKRGLLDILIQIKNAGKHIVGYGAPAKGNTLLNYCGIRTDFIDYTVDRNPHKQGHYLPGTHIPIESVNKIRETKPDYIFMLPWNLKNEIMDQMADIRQWGGKFIVPIPTPQIF